MAYNVWGSYNQWGISAPAEDFLMVAESGAITLTGSPVTLTAPITFSIDLSNLSAEFSQLVITAEFK